MIECRNALGVCLVELFGSDDVEYSSLYEFAPIIVLTLASIVLN